MELFKLPAKKRKKAQSTRQHVIDEYVNSFIKAKGRPPSIVHLYPKDAEAAALESGEIYFSAGHKVEIQVVGKVTA